MDQVTGPNRLFTQGDNVVIIVFADSLSEVELRLELVLFHHRVVIFVSDFFLHQAVALVFLSIVADLPSVLRLNPSEVEDLGLLLFSEGICADFAPSTSLGLIGR